jgi:hypothetical protein
MNSSTLLRFVTIGVLTSASVAFSQNAIADLLASKKLSNVPVAYQDRIKPGSIIIMESNGSIEFYDADDTAMPLSKKAMQGPLPTIMIEYIDSKLSTSGSFAAQFLKWGPGLKRENENAVTSDQAVLSVASLPQETIDDLVYRDSKTKERYESWNRPGKRRLADVYIVEAVYWATELQITSSASRGINATTNGTLSACGDKKDGGPPKAKTSDGTISTKSSKTENDQKDGSIRATAVNAGKAAIQSVAKDLGSMASATVSAATQGLDVPTVITISGGNCRDSHDVAHLTSAQPVPVGMKVDLIGYFKSDPNRFDWDPVPPPLF